MLMIDVDNFKLVNDRYGHMFERRCALTEMASRISSHFRDSDIVSRIGGDEFMVFMPGVGKYEMVNGTGRARLMKSPFQTMFKIILRMFHFRAASVSLTARRTAVISEPLSEQ